MAVAAAIVLAAAELLDDDLLAAELLDDGCDDLGALDVRGAVPTTVVAAHEQDFGQLDCGAILHIQEHAAEYGVDPTRLAVTGDSAGGHLSAAVINMTTMIGDGGFGAGEGPNLVVRNGIGDGLAVSVAFKSNVCPFLYTVKVTLSPTALC